MKVRIQGFIDNTSIIVRTPDGIKTFNLANYAKFFSIDDEIEIILHPIKGWRVRL